MISSLLKISSGINEIISVLSNQAMDHDVVSESEHEKAEKKSRKKRDPNAPKPATSAYQFFMTAMHPVIKKEMPNLPPNEFFKAIAQRWKTLSEEDKKAYSEKADLSKQQYLERLKAFKGQGMAEITPVSSPVITSKELVLPIDSISPSQEDIEDSRKDGVREFEKSEKSKKRSLEEKSSHESSQEKKKKKKKKKQNEEIKS